MEGIEVKLIDSMGGDLSIVNSARTSFAKWKEEMDEKDERLVNYLGEHEHMCYDEHTEILTNEGWKLFKDVSESMKVAQVFGWENNHLQMEFVYPTKLASFDFEGDMICTSHSKVSYRVTPEHRMLYMKRTLKGVDYTWRIDTAENLFGKFKRLPTCAEWVQDNKNKEFYEGVLLGVILSDGYRPSDYKNKVMVRLKVNRKIEFLKDLLGKLNLEYNLSVETSGVHSFSFNFEDEIYDSEKRKYYSIKKVIENGSSFCKGLYEGFVNSDGSKKRNTYTFSSTSRNLIELFMLSATFSGYRPIENKKVESENKNHKTSYRVMVQTYDNVNVNKGLIKEYKEQYSGKVYCATVPSGMLLVRRDGLQVVCGNTPFRHNCLQFMCTAPVFIARQLMKHQSGLTWNERSMRYLDEPVGYFVPEYWRERPDKSIKQGSAGKHDNSDMFDHLYTELLDKSCDLYEEMIKDGVAPEMARMVLPQSMLVTWVWTGNLMAFAHVYNLRIKSNAQIEAQEFAKALAEEIPESFKIGWEALTK